jgi:predicted dehydrogenase
MPKALRVLVLGSGFAGQGHAEAFRNAGVEIIGMVSRTLSVTQQVAKKMNIPYATTD